jgi:N-acetylneuraminic acid mutarotase
MKSNKQRLALATIVTLLFLLLIIIPSHVSATDLANTWSNKASMPQSEKGIEAVAVDGLIYVMGSSINLEYNPSTDNWTAKTPMPTQRNFFQIAVNNNMIYVIGGRFSSVNEVYDPSTDTWEAKTSIPKDVSDLNANVVAGKIYLIGLLDDNEFDSVNLVYDINTDSWSSGTEMPYPVQAYSSVVFNDKIYFFGGIDNEKNVPDRVQIYDPQTDSWSTGASMPEPVFNAVGAATTGTISSERIYVFGGQAGSLESVNNTQSYDPCRDVWTMGTPMPTARLGLTCSVVDDKVYVIGGSMMPVFSPALNNNEVYLPFGYGSPDSTTGEDNLFLDNYFSAFFIFMLLAVAVSVLLIFRKHRKTSAISS